MCWHVFRGGNRFSAIQVGLSGLLIFALVALVGYPIAYAHQKLYLNVLAEAPQCEDFAGIISGYLGKNWGFFLGALYFVFTTILLFLYSTALTNDSSSFLMTFGVTDTPLVENMFYGVGSFPSWSSLRPKGKSCS